MPLTLTQLQSIMPLAKDRARLFLEPLAAAMTEFGIDTPLRQAAFLAQVCHESGHLLHVEELASGAVYDIRPQKIPPHLKDSQIRGDQRHREKRDLRPSQRESQRGASKTHHSQMLAFQIQHSLKGTAMSYTPFDFQPLTIEQARETLIYAIEKQQMLARKLARLTAEVQINQRSFGMVFDAVEAACNSLSTEGD